ncbi:SLBB domain-containing protein [candidate division KSB1 bacterium]|nr:SLBB domain-containing protein [candidate division KSB1 bacterium]
MGLIFWLLLSQPGASQTPASEPKVTTNPALSNPTTTAPEIGTQVFGADFFRGKKQVAPVQGMQILPANYTLGPGDRLGLYLTGSEPIQFDVLVNVEGKIFIPSVGVLSTDNLTLVEFRKLLNQKLARYYSNYQIDLMLLSPKYIQVAVIGDVQLPGHYDVSALSTVYDAILMAGGPTACGSLRNIQIFRNNQLLKVCDLYTFLMQAQVPDPILLQTGDRIFVPLLGAKCQVQGEVRRRAIFELRPGGEDHLKDILDLAGGFTEFAYQERIEISRIDSQGNRQVSYVNYRELAIDFTNRGPLIENEDLVRIYSTLDQKHQAMVGIYGEVRNPGAFPWQANLRVGDLILMAGNVVRSAYTLSAEVARIDPLKPARVIKIDLHAILNDPTTPDNLLLEDDDAVYIRKTPDWLVGPTVEIIGEMKFPGRYPISRDSTWLSEILQQAGGFTNEALIREAVVIRKSSRIYIDKEYERLQAMTRDEMSESEYQYLVMKQNMRDIGEILVDFYKLHILKDKNEDIRLKDGDIIQVPKAPVVVQVTGRVSRPGGVLYQKGQKLKYYLKKAGGASWDADVRNTKVTKVTGEILNYRHVDELVPGDIIWVPREPHRDWWVIFRDTIAVISQLATIYLIIDNVSK